MTKKIGDKKVTGIKSSEVGSAEEAKGIKGAGEVGAVGAVKGTGAVGATGGAGSISGNGSRATRVMSYAEREKIFKMVSEEAEKIFAKSKVSGEKQKLVADAVRMAIDSGLVPPDGALPVDNGPAKGGSSQGDKGLADKSGENKSGKK